MRKLFIALILFMAIVSCENPALPAVIDGDPIETGPGVTDRETENVGETDNDNVDGDTDNNSETDDSGEGGESNEGHHVHVAGDWVIPIAPACEEDGLRELRCVEDGAVMETEPVPVIGHNWNE